MSESKNNVTIGINSKFNHESDSMV